jgi:hypothetical protein
LSEIKAVKLRRLGTQADEVSERLHCVAQVFQIGPHAGLLILQRLNGAFYNLSALAHCHTAIRPADPARKEGTT